jgi:hypothetical protein
MFSLAKSLRSTSVFYYCQYKSHCEDPIHLQIGVMKVQTSFRAEGLIPFTADRLHPEVKSECRALKGIEKTDSDRTYVNTLFVL